MRDKPGHKVKLLESALCLALGPLVKDLSKRRGLTAGGLVHELGLSETDRRNLTKGTLPLAKALILVVNLSSFDAEAKPLSDSAETIIQNLFKLAELVPSSHITNVTKKLAKNPAAAGKSRTNSIHMQFGLAFRNDARLLLEDSFTEPALAGIRVLRAYLDCDERFPDPLRDPKAFRNCYVQ